MKILKKRKRRKKYRGIGLIIVCILLFVAVKIMKKPELPKEETLMAGDVPIDVQLLTINPYSRPGVKTDGIRGVVIHYTANPMSTAQNNRDYFESLKDSHANKVSSNFVVGLSGEIIQCIPTWEIAYASNERNRDTISIEVCHEDTSGKFNRKTYRSLVKLTAMLCNKYHLQTKDVIRHYDVTGKNCPKYFVEHEDAWKKFRKDVKEEMKNG